ncbi:MAG: integration host factor subunit beta [Cryomorphaceae bacterium]|nr:integration host factor subunit beta [Cryomorphaceae bacterium]
MTKADIISKVADRTGMEKADVLAAVEGFMREVKSGMESGENVYLRGFGSFVLKSRAQKTGRNISKNTTLVIPAHFIPSFKPAKTFAESVKKNVPVKK